MITDLLLDVAVFVALPSIAWRLTRRVVPLAVLPILVGLGLSVAGHHSGGGPLLRPSEAADLAGWVGVLLLAYVAGLEASAGAADDGDAGGKPGAAIAKLWSWRLLISTATALALPFAAGLLLAEFWLLRLPAWSPPNGDDLAAALAIGLCLAVSALPVLVAIVQELPASSRALGSLALRVAALSDAALWLGLSFLLVAISATDAAAGWGTVDIAAAVVLGALVLGGRWLARRRAHVSAPVAWLIGIAFLAGGAWGTSVLGLHALVGAYLAGMLTPTAVARHLPAERLAFIALAGLAPLFFGHRGLAIDGAALDGQSLAAAVGLLIVSAAAKIGAVLMAPPSRDLSRRDRLALGTLLQCKGLMEIVAATVLRDHGVFTDTAYAVLIGLAVLSTTATKPLYGWIRRSRVVQPAPADSA